MKYALFSFPASEDGIKVNPLIKKLPKAMVNYYIEKVNPYRVRELNILGAEGLEVMLPIVHKDDSRNIIREDFIIKKTTDELITKGVDIFIPGEKIVFPGGTPVADGKSVMAFFIMPLIKRALKAKSIDLKAAEILVIDGGNFTTELTIDCIYSHVNFLSIYTDKAESFMYKKQEIYEEVGLNVQTFASCKNPVFKNADIIINCGRNSENYDYFLKTGAIYIDIERCIEKQKRLLSRRKDIVFIDSPKIKIDGTWFSPPLLEGVMYCLHEDFRMFLNSRYNKLLQENIGLYFDSLGAVVYYKSTKKV